MPVLSLESWFMKENAIRYTTTYFTFFFFVVYIRSWLKLEFGHVSSFSDQPLIPTLFSMFVVHTRFWPTVPNHPPWEKKQKSSSLLQIQLFRIPLKLEFPRALILPKSCFSKNDCHWSTIFVVQNALRCWNSKMTDRPTNRETNV